MLSVPAVRATDRHPDRNLAKNETPSGHFGACNENQAVNSEDTAFRSAFETLWGERRLQLATTISIAIRLDDQLHHCYGGHRTTQDVVGDTYHPYKTVALASACPLATQR